MNFDFDELHSDIDERGNIGCLGITDCYDCKYCYNCINIKGGDDTRNAIGIDEEWFIYCKDYREFLYY